MKRKSILWLMALSALCASIAYAADLRMLQKQRAAESKFPSQQIGTQPSTGLVAVSSVNPMFVQLEPGKSAVTVTVKGSNLDKATQVEVVQAGQAMKEIEARLGAFSASTRQIILRAAAGVRAGSYQVLISGGSQRVEIPLSLLRVEVKAVIPPAATAKPQSVSGQAPELQNKQAVVQKTAAISREITADFVGTMAATKPVHSYAPISRDIFANFVGTMKTSPQAPVAMPQKMMSAPGQKPAEMLQSK